MSLPASKFLNIIYMWVMDRIDPAKREQWEYQLDAPLPGQVERPATEEQLEQEFSGFAALMANTN